jgi:tetratricopeptide (TPR) repeat protein
MTLSDGANYADSNPMYSELLESAARTLGENHGIYLSYVKAYADSLRVQGRAEQLVEAEELLRTLAEIREQVNGPAHPVTIRGNVALGSVLVDRGQLNEAEPLIVQALQAFRELEQGDHVDIALASSSLGQLRLVQGRASEAEPLLLEALEMRRRLFQPEHPSVQQAEIALSRCRAALEQ